MRKVSFTGFSLVFSLLYFCAPLRSHVAPTKVKLGVILVDKDLNQKPVPHLAVRLAADSNNPSPPQDVKTDFAGAAEFQAPPGKYRLPAGQGVDFQERHYTWDVATDVSGESVSVDLSDDNARTADPILAEPAPKVDDLTLMFQK